MAMNLKNMASKEAENNDVPDGVSSTSRYGYGLNIRLNDEQMKTLGISKPIKAGTVVVIEAKAIVESTRESVEGNVNDDNDGDKTDMGMTLQITDMGLEEAGESPNPAEILYTTS